jgi:Predicted enzyme with a TIM-barrel fold
LKSINKLPKSIASSLVYCRYISPKRKRNSVSLLTNAGKCWIQADGRIWKMSAYQEWWVWRPMWMTTNKSKENFVP